MFTAWILLMLNSLFFTLRLSGGGSGSFPRPLKAEEERMYLERMAQGDLEARNILIEHNLRLVAHIMKKYYTPNGDQDDLISIGTIGLIKGISTFKPDKNVRLATYASRCIENEILMHFRAQRKLQGEVSLSDSIDGDGDGNSLSLMDTISVDDNMLEELDARDSCAKVRRCVKRCLDEREAMIITLRYGLNARPAPDPAGDRGPVRHLPLLCIAPRLLQARRGMSPGAGTARTETPPSLRCQSGKSQLLGGRPGVPDVRPTSTPVVQSAQRIPEGSGHQVNEYAVGGTAGQVPSGQGIQKAVVLKFPAVPDYGADSALHRD